MRARVVWLFAVMSLIGSTTMAVGAPRAAAAVQSSYQCHQNNVVDAIEGVQSSASAIGWAGNYQGVVTCLGGNFYVQSGLDRPYGFGVYRGGPISWVDADHYLPAQITSFKVGRASVTITEFADRVVIANNPFVLVYSQVAVTNHGSSAVVVNPDPTPGLTVLAAAPNRVGPGHTADHDYVVASDRFGTLAPWPTPSAMVAAGGFHAHFLHMAAFWRQQLKAIAQIDVPDRQLEYAYKSGFITTQIARAGTHLNTGINGYDAEFSHDVVGILANLFTQGDYADAHGLLLEMRDVVGSQRTYTDGLWTYAWPWAIYLMKTGDLAFVKANFATPGAKPAKEPSIEQAAHTIAADRVSPNGIMEESDDIDSNGFWTIDDFEALMGLAAYRYLAQQVGDDAEVNWATYEYDTLLAATDGALDRTIASGHLDYLPCSLIEPNTANRCTNPEDANWAAPFLFGRWAWDAPLFGTTVTGPGVALIDATYDYGFDRLKGLLPADTLGGYPGDYYSTGYDAGYGEWGLASKNHRSQGIDDYEFMIANDQSGPYSWWESSSVPVASDWIGRHPSNGQGAAPHAWGMADANKVLLDSLATQSSNGAVIVGRGVPTAWLRPGIDFAVTNFPTTDNHRLGLSVATHGSAVTLTVTGHEPGPVLFELPAFVDNISSVSAGTTNAANGVVTVAPGAHRVVVHLRHLRS